MIGELFDPRKEFGKAVTEVAKTDSRVVVLSADSGKSSGFGNFMAEFPDRYFECGIMEQGVVGMAAGVAGQMSDLTDLDLHILGGDLTDHHAVLTADVTGNHLVKVVARHLQ